MQLEKPVTRQPSLSPSFRFPAAPHSPSYPSFLRPNHLTEQTTDYSTHSSGGSARGNLSHGLFAQVYAEPSMQQYRVMPPYLKESSSPVVDQPVSLQVPSNGNSRPISAECGEEHNVPQEWRSGKCQCCDGTNTCCAICCCLFCFECWLADKLGEGCCMPWCVPLSTMALRLKMRMKYNIKGTILKDFWASIFCKPCILCQMKREMDHWEMERERRQQAMNNIV